MRTEAQVREMRNKFETFVEDEGNDPGWDAIIDALNWVLEDAGNLSQYEPI